MPNILSCDVHENCQFEALIEVDTKIAACSNKGSTKFYVFMMLTEASCENLVS